MHLSQHPLCLTQAHTNMRLAAARADLSKLNTEVNEVLASLAGVCSHLTGLLKDSPQHWLLSVADMSGYDQQDMAARQVFARCAASWHMTRHLTTLSTSC